MRQRHAGGLLHFFQRNVRLAVGDVVAHRVVEEDGLLRDVADQPAQRVGFQIAHILAIHQQTAAGHVEEARYQVDQRGLAGAAGTHESHHLSARHGEIDTGENFLLPFFGRVGKAHVVEADFAAECLHTFRVRPVPHRVLLIHELEDVAGGAQGLLKVVVEESELAHRIVELEDGDDEGEEGACIERPFVDLVTTQQEQQRDGNGADDIHERRTDSLSPHRVEIRPEETARRLLEARGLPTLHGEGLHDAIAGDGLVQDVLDLGQLVLTIPGGVCERCVRRGALS